MAEVDYRPDVYCQYPREITCIPVEERPLSGEAGVVDQQVDVTVDKFTQSMTWPLD